MRTSLSRFLFLTLISLLSFSCSFDPSSSSGSYVGTKQQTSGKKNKGSLGLVGGMVAPNSFSPLAATSAGLHGPSGNCSATRIGERHFLTATHCNLKPGYLLPIEADASVGVGLTRPIANSPLSSPVDGSYDTTVIVVQKRQKNLKSNVGDDITQVLTPGASTSIIASVGSLVQQPTSGERFHFFGWGKTVPPSTPPFQHIRMANFFNALSQLVVSNDRRYAELVVPDYSAINLFSLLGLPSQHVLAGFMPGDPLNVSSVAALALGGQYYDPYSAFAANGDSGGALFDQAGSAIAVAHSNVFILGSFPASNGQNYLSGITTSFEWFDDVLARRINERLEIPIIDHFKKDTVDTYKLDALALRPGDTFEIQGYALDGGTLKFNGQDLDPTDPKAGELKNGVVADASTPKTKRFTVTILPYVAAALTNTDLVLTVEKDSTITHGKKLKSESSDRKLKILRPEITALARVKSGDLGGAMNTLASLVGSSPTGSVNVERGESILIAGKWMFYGLSPEVSLPTIDPSILGVSQITQGVPQSLLDQGYEVWAVQVPSTFLTGRNSNVVVVGSNPLIKSGQIIRIVGLKDWEQMVSYEKLNQGGELAYPDGSSIICPSVDYSQPQDFCIIEVKTLEQLSSGIVTHALKMAGVAQHSLPPKSHTTCSNLGNIPAETCLTSVISMKGEFNVDSNSMDYEWGVNQVNTDTWYMAIFDKAVFLRYEKQVAVRTSISSWKKTYRHRAVQTQREQPSGKWKISTVIDSYFSGSGTSKLILYNIETNHTVSGFSYAPFPINTGFSLNETTPELGFSSSPVPDELNGAVHWFLRASPTYTIVP